MPKLFSAILLSVVTYTISAQTTEPLDDPTADYVLPETVVIANRVETPSEEVGSSVSVITAEQLEQRQIRLVSDALREIPGVAVSRTGVAGTLTDVRIRGAESNHTLVLIDGIEANDPAAGSIFDFAHLLTTDIERIEVLRGPQSALWGSDAIGGVINIISKRGQAGPPQSHASIEGGSFNTARANAGVSGGGEAYHYSLGASYLDTDGASIAPTGSEDDGYDNTTLSFKAGFTPTSHLSFDAIARYTSATSQTDPQDFDFGSATFGQIVDGDEHADTDQLYGRAQAKLALLDGDWEHTIGIALTDTDSDFFSDGMQRSGIDGAKTKVDYQTNYFFTTTDTEHTLTFAAELENEDFSQRGETADAPRNQDQSIDNQGYVGEYRLGLWDQWFLTGAVRLDNNDRFADETSYRLTAAYVLDSGMRLHSSYGTGVKNPSFTELFGFFPGSFIGNANLEPEKTKGWDVGVEYPLLKGRLVADVTYFDSDFEDEIVTTFDNETFLSSVENAIGTSNRRGLELSLRGSLTEQLSLTGSFTYTDSEDPDGEQEARRPRHSASLNLNYSLLAKRATINLGVVYTGEQKDLDFATFPATRVTLDDYTLVNLAARYQVNDTLEVFGRVENLLDEDYQDVFGYDTLGIGAYAGLRVNF